MNESRRTLIAAGLATTIAPAAFAQRALPQVEVWKSPTCGCCKDWIAHLETEGFKVKVNEVPDTSPFRAKAGIPERLGSCHTAKVDGYALEGHVPARDVRRLLAERPKAVGLAVPGMPVGSPGMDGPVYQGRKDPYDVLLVTADGRWSIFQSYN